MSALYAFQKPFREYPGVEYSKFPLPPDYKDSAEWTFARLMYPPVGRYTRRLPDAGRLARGRLQLDHRLSRAPTVTSAAGRPPPHPHQRPLRRSSPSTSTMQTTSTTGPGSTPSKSATGTSPTARPTNLREFLLRGGFFMCDDFHGDVEWDVFIASMKKVFPDRPIVDLPNNDPIFHTIYDLNDRYQVPGAQFMRNRPDLRKGRHRQSPHWRAIYDDKGRVMVAMCHNMDLGDSWEHADNPEYPARFSDLGIRIGVNYVTYAMSH